MARTPQPRPQEFSASFSIPNGSPTDPVVTLGQAERAPSTPQRVFLMQRAVVACRVRITNNQGTPIAGSVSGFAQFPTNASDLARVTSSLFLTESFSELLPGASREIFINGTTVGAQGTQAGYATGADSSFPSFFSNLDASILLRPVPTIILSVSGSLDLVFTQDPLVAITARLVYVL